MDIKLMEWLMGIAFILYPWILVIIIVGGLIYGIYDIYQRIIYHKYHTKICPHCLYEISKYATKCIYCFSELKPEGTENVTKEPINVMKKEETVSKELITCKICNHDIPINSKTCMYCGTKEFH